MSSANTLADLFAAYEQAFTNLDVEASMRLFAECCIAAAPQFVGCTKGESELREALTQLYAFYQQIGLTSAHIQNLTEIPLDPHYTLAKVTWSARFRKQAQEPISFDVSYMVRTSEPMPQIILFISHQDERAVLAEHGLLSA
jgi:hypothetical protein